jgi:hypothetical protein
MMIISSIIIEVIQWEDSAAFRKDVNSMQEYGRLNQKEIG